MASTRKSSKARIAKVAAIARKEENRAGQELAKVFSTPAARVYFTTKGGLKSRVESKEYPVDRKEVAEFLKFNRAFGTFDALEEIGIGWVKAMVERGYILPHDSSVNADGLCLSGYFVTQKAVEVYDLPTRDAFGRKIMFLHDINAIRAAERKAA